MAGFSTNAETVLERKCDNHVRSPDGSFITLYELDKCVDWILKADACSVTNYLKSSTKAEIFILADTSYSSCCVDVVAAAHVDADAIVHFGPSCLSPCSGLPVFYVYPPGQLDIADLKQNVFSIASDDSKIVLFYETRFHKFLSELREAVSGVPSVSISEIAETNSADGVVCGRRIHETFQKAVFIGSDSMLLTNLSLIFPDVLWFIYDENQFREFPIKQNKFLMKRLHLVEKLKDAAAVGVLVGTLSIDGCLAAVNRVKQLCNLSGKKCYTVAVGRPNTAKLANFPEIDVFVLVSCPENRLFVETSEYFKPIVSLLEVELAFGGRPWSSDYTFDFRQLQPGGKLFSEGGEVKEDDGDVSLVTGKVRQMGIREVETESNTALMTKASGTLVGSHGAQFLSGRSWAGLEQKLGETAVEKVVQGRRGMPQAYQNEGSDK